MHLVNLYVEIDYITGFWLLFLLCLLPFILTRTPLDYLLSYMWINASLFSKLPFAIGNYPKNVVVANEAKATETLLCIALFSLIYKTKKDYGKMLKSLSAIAILTSIVAYPFDIRWLTGLVPNSAMNAILIVSLLLYAPGNILFLLGVFIVVMAKSSSAYLALASTVLYLFRAEIVKRWKAFLLLGFIAIAGLWSIDKDLLNPGIRFSAYQFFFRDFHGLDWFFGKGAGSFWAISTWMQNTYQFDMDNGYLFWMHSDPLQFVFEYGIIGLIPLAFSLTWLLTNLKDRAMIAVLAYLFGGIFYYPLHWPVHLLVLFMAISYERNS